MTTDQHGLITEDGRIIFYAHHLSDENRQKVANVKAVYDENEALKARIVELEAKNERLLNAVDPTGQLRGIGQYSVRNGG